MRMTMLVKPGVFFMAFCMLIGCRAADDAPFAYRKSAHFRITDEVVNPGLEPFAATIPAVGNSLIDINVSNTGFEPLVYRNIYTAQQNAPDRIVVEPNALSHYDTLREGFLDGAEVRVYRIENGRFDVVRTDRIPEGGFHVSGWHAVHPSARIVPPTSPRYVFRWDGHNRPDVPYYFTVRAVDRNGSLSPPAGAVKFIRPRDTGKGQSPTELIDFRSPRQTTSASSLLAPSGLRGQLQTDGSLVLEWDRQPEMRDLAGFIVYRSDYPPEQHAGYYIQLSREPLLPREHIRAGDLVIIGKKFYSSSRNRLFSNRVWGAPGETSLLFPGTINYFSDETPGKSWELVPHPTNTPVDQPGETCLKLTLAAGVKEIVGVYNHSGKTQGYYPVIEPSAYQVEAWMRQEGAGSVRFKMEGFYGSGTNLISPVAFNVGPQWTRHIATFRPATVQDNATPGRMAIEFTGPGTFYIDNFRVYRADASYLDLLPRQYDDIANSTLSALRTHGLVRTKFRTSDMEQLTNEGGVVSGTWAGNTFPQLLKIIRRTGTRPWLQIEFHMGPQEWLGFVEYMAAPYDPAIDTPTAKPWAHKRHAQGQARPWIEEFDRIYIELGNETWNRIFKPWVFGPMTDAANGRNYSAGQAYGLFQEHVIKIMRESPYWRHARLDDKISFVIGGWGWLPYGREAAEMSPSSRYLTIGAYNGGWDEGEGPPKLDSASLFNVLSHVNQTAIPLAEHHQRELRELNARRKVQIQLGTYEAGPGYALNGLNNARITEAEAREQEQVMKSLAAGTATLDSFLARAYRGFTLQNFFGYKTGPYWASHAPWYYGGQPYPSWQLLSLFNTHATGDMLRTEILSVPVTDLKPFERRKGASNVPLATVYATRKNNRHALVVISRKVPDYPFAGDDGYTPVVVDLPFDRAGSLTLYRMTGEPRANNLLSPRNVMIERLDLGAVTSRQFVLNAASGADDRGLPPASTFVYVFENTASTAVRGTSVRR